MNKIRVGLFLRLEASPGKEDEVAALLRDALPLAEQEPGTLRWYAIRLGATSSRVFDLFPDDEAREAHHHGPIAQAVQSAGARGLFAQSSRVEYHEVLAVKDAARDPSGDLTADV